MGPEGRAWRGGSHHYSVLLCPQGPRMGFFWTFLLSVPDTALSNQSHCPQR